ncbi:flagellar protein FlgN [Cohnella hashimotonis]|uniref:Flagellar protein FlgN n=1 Tax=Cohnella hashimotonis TaxID=2826895 RepID=A0ABT6TU14_9BACL|nr:flagellar protein FlgN [Cohnella hashimotonis]MDI4650347.1 flagellar protein FlgN [Cohnella hashimotonis]
MESAFEAILEPLHGLADIYGQLIGLSMDKREAVLANRVDVVAAVTNKEARLLPQVGELEAKRTAAVQSYLTGLGLGGAKNIRMEQLIRLIPNAEAKRALDAVTVRLTQATDELRQLNEFNQQMIRTHLEYIHYSIDVIAGPSEDEATYHRSLQEQGFSRPSQFDTRA